MRRQLIGVVLMAMIAAGGTLQVQAVEQTGTIRVRMEPSIDEAAVSLYRVGVSMEEGYRLPDDLGGGLIRREDAQSPELAQWLAETVKNEGEKRYFPEGGTVEFSDLQEGLYLLTQSETEQDFLPAVPFLVPIPCNGVWEVTAHPKTQKIWTESPQTGQHPAPIIGAMGIVLSGMGLAVCLEKIRKK